MKLAKLSLAAIMAAGAFSVANATSLEDAIKGVDLSGMVRLRFYNNDRDKSSKKSDQNRWRGSSIFKFTIPISDTFKFHYDVLAEQNAISAGSSTTSISGSGNGTSTVSNAGVPVGTGKVKGMNSLINAHIFLSYSNAGLNVIAGRIPVVTSVTPPGYLEPLGSGIVATYGLGNGFTVAGGYVDDIENTILNDTGPYTKGSDIVAGAILYNSDMLGAQVWGYRISQVVKSDFTFSLKVKPMAGLTLAGDFATSKLDDEVSANAKSHNFWNLSATYKVNGFTLMGGYADTNKHPGAIVLNNDAALGNITGDQDYNLANETDSNAWYAKIGYDIDAKTNIYATYHSIEQEKTASRMIGKTKVFDDDRDEYVFGGSYKYNKKLKFSGLYSVLDHDHSDKYDNNELKLEAKYTF